jgi:hypothetical protein
VSSEYDSLSREDREAHLVERLEFERVKRSQGFDVCSYDDEICSVRQGSVGKIKPCFVWGRDSDGRLVLVYVCLRVKLRGGQGFGMSLLEKLSRQGLLPKGVEL